MIDSRQTFDGVKKIEARVHELRKAINEKVDECSEQNDELAMTLEQDVTQRFITDVCQQRVRVGHELSGLEMKLRLAEAIQVRILERAAQ